MTTPFDDELAPDIDEADDDDAPEQDPDPAPPRDSDVSRFEPSEAALDGMDEGVTL